MALTTKRPSERAGALFSKPEHKAYGPEYLRDLKEEWRSVLAGQKRAMTYMFLSMALFELVARGAIGKATILGIEVSDLAIARKALPVVAAFFFYEAANYQTLHHIFFGIYDGVFRELHPEVSDARLQILTYPSSSTIRGPLIYGSGTPGLEDKRYIHGLNEIFSAASFLIILAFEVYAYTLQFAQFHATDPLTWIALAVTLIFVVIGFLGPYLHR